MSEDWFTLDTIERVDNDDKLYCLSVTSPDELFLAGRIGVPTHNSKTDEGKRATELAGEASMIISSIARLGRAASVFILLAMQRPDHTLLPGELKSNLGVRIACGRSDSTASNMILGNAEGCRIKSKPRGRLFCSIYGSGNHAQGFFAEPDWIDKWLTDHNMHADGSLINDRPALPRGSSSSGDVQSSADVDDDSDFTIDDLIDEVGSADFVSEAHKEFDGLSIAHDGPKPEADSWNDEMDEIMNAQYG